MLDPRVYVVLGTPNLARTIKEECSVGLGVGFGA